jgi:hypothetical protein
MEDRTFAEFHAAIQSGRVMDNNYGVKQKVQSVKSYQLSAVSSSGIAHRAWRIALRAISSQPSAPESLLLAAFYQL